MNACEDESEPLGEWSELPRITATVQLVERQGRALTKIRELHPRKIRPFPGDVFEAICVGCGNLWPCSTIRAIDEAGV